VSAGPQRLKPRFNSCALRRGLSRALSKRSESGFKLWTPSGLFLSSLRDWAPFLFLTQRLRAGLYSFAALRLGSWWTGAIG